MKSQLKPRIVNLEPMNVVSCHATGKQPELDAFRLISDWAREFGVLDTKDTRFFGFDNPAPSAGGGEYGYEVWMSTGSKLRTSKKAEIKDFSGGMYAVIRTSLPQIGQSWRELIAWRAESKYGEGSHQCLEEHHVLPLNNSPEDIEIDLYLPIAE